MLCQYLNKYKNNWSEIAIKLNVSHSNLLLLEGSGEEIIFSKIYFSPKILLVDFLVENLFACRKSLRTQLRFIIYIRTTYVSVNTLIFIFIYPRF